MSCKEIKISVILPVYNVEKYLRFSVKSILNQDYKLFELIAINDGSTDNSLQILQSFNDDRIKIVDCNKNNGLAETRNIGLKYATGDVIYFMDSDDEIRPNLFSIAIKQLFKSSKVDMVVFNSQKVNRLGPPDLIKKAALIETADYNSSAVLRMLMDGKLLTTSWSFISQRRLIESCQLVFSKGRLFEDMNTTSLLFANSRLINILTLDPAPYLYFQRDTSIMGKAKKKPSLKEIRDAYYMVNSESDILAKYYDPTEAVIWKFNLLFYFYSSYIESGVEKKLLKKYVNSMKNIYKKHYRSISVKGLLKLISAYFPTLITLLRKIKKPEMSI